MEFDISIEVPLDNDSWKLVYIPSMLLQIHTENAIEKGIRQRKAANCFKTRIKNFPEHLEIYLEDDGIGRKNQQSDKVVLTRKGSTDVMQDLIDVLNQYNKTKLSIQYIDNIFTDELGTPYGTGILIILPKPSYMTFHKLKALVVEDESAIRLELINALDESPEIEVAGSAETLEEAYELISGTASDMLFLDINLIGELHFSC